MTMNQSPLLYSEGKIWLWAIIVIVVLGGLLLSYYYYYYGVTSSVLNENYYLPTKSSSDSVSAVANDIQQMDTVNLDKELLDIDKELAQ